MGKTRRKGGPQASKAFAKFWPRFSEACKQHKKKIQENGSLGHGTLKHTNVKKFILPLAQHFKVMPRLVTCVQLVEKANAKYKFCPSGQNEEGWVAKEAKKVHKWFHGASRQSLSTLTIKPMKSFCPLLLKHITKLLAIFNLFQANLRCQTPSRFTGFAQLWLWRRTGFFRAFQRQRFKFRQRQQWQQLRKRISWQSNQRQSKAYRSVFWFYCWMHWTLYLALFE